MLIRRYDPTVLESAWNIHIASLFPLPGVVSTPFGALSGVVRPGEQSRRHNHYEGEIFLIARGRGRLSLAGEVAEVGAGDAIYLPPLAEHTLENLDPADDLSFFSVYWGDPELLAQRQRELHARTTQRASRVLITATPPTPNGDLHCGHLSGPYLAADVYRRYLDLRGVECQALCGADIHQSYVAVKASQEGRSPAETAGHFGELMLDTLRLADIDLDLWVRPDRSAHHTPRVREMFERLWAAGALEVRDAPSLHCEPCQRYTFEAYVGGTCPHCRSGTNGNACEECGRPNDCADLIAPRCKVCGTPPTTRTTRRIYFPLQRYAAQLTRYLDGAVMNPHLRTLCEQMIAEGLPDIALTHLTDWGIPVPVPGFEGQRLYVWFEMAAGYLAATEELAARDQTRHAFTEVWGADGGGEVVQFFGFDNGYFHALLFPALYFAYRSDLRPPRCFVMNEFYRLEGSKFSTSRQHAVWGHDILARWPADAVRFYLAHTAPEVEQTNFSAPAMERTLREEIGGVWQSWLEGLGQKVAARHQGRAPDPGQLPAELRAFHHLLLDLQAEMARAYEAETFSPQQATRTLMRLVAAARRFGLSEDPRAALPARRDVERTAVALELAAARALALWASPVMPTFAARLWSALGHDTPIARGHWEEAPAFVGVGQPIGDLGAAAAETARPRHR